MPFFKPGPREPHGEAVRIVIAAVHHAGVRAVVRQLDRRRAAKFAAPDDQRVLQHASLLQILEQRRDRLIALPRELAVIRLDVVVAVPGLAGAVPHLHEAHAALQQPPRDHHLPRLQSFAVHLVDVLRLLRQIERVVGLHLHAIGEFERLDARLEQRIVLPRASRCLPIQFGQQIELLALLGRCGVASSGCSRSASRSASRGVDVRRLVGAGQKRRSPVLRCLASASRRGTAR